MGLLVDGQWHDQWYDTKTNKGRFERSEAKFRNWITADGSAGPTGQGGFPAAAGRYHLYIGHACPWAHRTLIFRMLKGLEDKISLSVVHWHMAENGWTFADGQGVIPDPVNAANYMQPSLYRSSARFFRAGHHSGVVGHRTGDNCQQRIIGNHSDVQRRLRRHRCDPGGLLPDGITRQHRRRQCAGLRDR